MYASDHKNAKKKSVQLSGQLWVTFNILGHPVVKAEKKVYQKWKCTKQKLSDIVQVNVPIFFHFDEISKIRSLQ